MSLIVACNTVVPWKCVSSRFLTAPSLEIRVRRLVYWKRKKRIIFEAISCMFPVFSVSRGTQGKTLKAHGPLGCEFSAKAPPFEMSSVSLAHPLQTTAFFLPLCDDTVLFGEPLQLMPLLSGRLCGTSWHSCVLVIPTSGLGGCGGVSQIIRPRETIKTMAIALLLY